MAILTQQDAGTDAYLRRKVMEENTLQPENITVLYRSEDADSIAIKDLYVAARSIPAGNVIGYDMSAWTVGTNVSEAFADTLIQTVYPQMLASGNETPAIVLCGDWPDKAGDDSFQHYIRGMGFRYYALLSGGMIVTIPGLYEGFTLYPDWSFDDPTVYSRLGGRVWDYRRKIPFIPAHKAERPYYAVFSLEGEPALVESMLNRSLAAEGAYNTLGRVLCTGQVGNDYSNNDLFLDEISRWGMQDSGIYWDDIEPREFDPNDEYGNRGMFYNSALYRIGGTTNESISGMCGKTGVSTWASCTEEHWTGTPALAGTGWADNGDGSFTHSGTVSGNVRVTGTGLIEDAWYTVKVTVAGANLSNAKLGGPATNGYNISAELAPGTHILRLAAESVSSFNGIRFTSNKAGTVISDISVYPENIEVGLRAVGANAYYGQNAPCESAGDYRYRDGAICLFSQSSPASGRMALSPTWEANVPTLIDGAGLQAKEQNIIDQYNTDNDTSKTAIGSYWDSYGNVNCTINGVTRYVMGLVYTGVCTTATIDIASNVITMKVDGATVHTVSAGKTYKEIYDDVQAYGSGWDVYLWSSGGTPNRVECAIRSGATAAIGCSHEPGASLDVDAVNIATVLYAGGCLGDWVITRVERMRHWFCYGDPLLRPVTGRDVISPGFATNPFTIPGSTALPSACSLSDTVSTGTGITFTTDYNFSATNSVLTYEWNVNKGEWQAGGKITTAGFNFPSGVQSGDEFRYRLRVQNPYGYSDPSYDFSVTVV